MIMTPSSSPAGGYAVIVCGSLHLDIVVQAPALPRIDETAVGTAWRQVCGGKGGNQAVQAARFGAPTAMIGRVGNDAFGKTLRANLEAGGVATAAVATDTQQGSGMSVAILQDDGDYGAVIVSGANLRLEPESLQDAWHVLGGARVLVLQNEIPHAVNVAAARVAHQQGATVVWNAAPARNAVDDLVALTDVLIVNRVEAEAMSGQPVTDRASAHRALPHVKAKRAIVITLGGNGLVWRDANGTVNDCAAIPVDVTSTHGAGDCFVGVLAACLARGDALATACTTANASAAAFVSTQRT
jgi:ribokinase